MPACKKCLLLASVFLFLFPFSNQTFALGEAVSELVDKVGESLGIGYSAKVIDQNADIAIKKLFQNSPAAAKLSKTAKAILIYPKILKAGMGLGGHHGEGALRENGKTIAYFNTIAGSYGLQIGAQSFGYAMFFMDEKALEHLTKSEGWEVGVGPSVVMVDDGMAKTLTTTTAKDSIYVFTFNQEGLMAGAGIQGSKITRITPKK